MPTPHDSPPDRVVELAVNLDDVTGEQLGETIDQLMRAGALDAWATPITMKKGRPGVTLSVLAKQDDRDALVSELFNCTGSFGVRYRAWDRAVLERTWHDRPTRWGTVQLKAGALDGRAVTVKPEFASVAALASSAGVGLAEAQRAAQAAADALLAELRGGSGSPEGGPGDG